MARIFTTTFQFNHERYDAIITIFSNSNGPQFHVRVLSESLLELIPSGEICYSGRQGFQKISSLDNTLAQTVMLRISEAIDKHLLLMEQGCY